MIKKRGLIISSFLIGFLFLILGVYLTSGGTGQSVDNESLTLTFVNTTTRISSGNMINATQNTFADKWVARSGELVVNFTVTNLGIGNISVINITIPDHVFRLHMGTGMSNGTSWTNGSIGKFMDMDNSSKSVWVQNLTGLSRLIAGPWTGELVNTTTANAVNHTSPTTTNVTIWFNITANANVTTEDVYTFVIATKGRQGNETSANKPIMNVNATHNVTIGIDGRGPRILDINITEVYSGTPVNGRTISLFKDELNGTKYLSPNAAFNITVVVNDTNFNATDGSVIVYWNSTSPSSTPKDITINASVGMNRVQLTRASNERLSRLGPIVFEGQLIAQTTLNGSNFSAFIIVVNDTFNNRVFYNSTGHSFNFSVEDQAPIITVINVTDERSNVLRSDVQGELNGTKYLMATSAYVIRMTVTDPSMNKTTPDPKQVMIVFGGNATNRKEVPPSISNALGVANFTINMSTTDLTSPFMYNGTIPKGTFNNTNLTTFMIYANDSLFGNPARVVNISGGGFNFTADGTSPVGFTITPPAITTIDLSSSISYRCEASDVGSGVKEITITLTKPSGATVTKTDQQTQSFTTTFTDTDTNAVGSYSVDCSAKDVVGNEGLSSTDDRKSFTVQFETAGTSTGGGGGSSGGKEAPAFDADFSQEGITEATFSGFQGRTKTFTFDGSTRHTLKFDEVTEGGATITIASINPQTITLKTGDSKEVDMNGDGGNDVSVILESIISGRATIMIKELSGSAKIVEELREEASKEACGNSICESGEDYTNCPTDCTAPTIGEPPVVPVKERGTTWLWILLLVIVVALVLYLVMRKRKK